MPDPERKQQRSSAATSHGGHARSGRRAFIVAVAGAAALRVAGLRADTKLHRIGFLGNSTAELEANRVGPFREGLRDLGYVEGGDLEIVYRWADGDYSRFPALVAELLAEHVDVIVTAGTPAAQVVERAKSSVPLVMVAVGDPVGTHLVASLAHPGGNATGLTSIAPDLEGKRLELLTQIVPSLASVAVVWNPDNAFHIGAERQAQIAAKRLKLAMLSVRVRSVSDFDAAFDSIARGGAGALSVLADRIYLHNRARIVAFAAHRRLPAVYAYRELVDAGGLMSFGPDYAEMHRRAATYVDRIFKGAKPGDLPIEQPTKFQLLVNLRAADAIGLSIPKALLVRADEIIR